MTEREQELEQALQDLVSKLEFIHESTAYKAVWHISQMHIGPYNGPNYIAELTHAKQVLEN